MAIAHIVVLTAALLTLLCLPCVVAAVVCVDSGGLATVRRLRALRRLDRVLRADDSTPRLAQLGSPSIEQLAFDLRRLAQQRRSGPTQHSERWLAAVQRAYDERLCLACHCLGVDEHLRPLEGMDRDLERLRMEHELQAAGLALR